MSWPSACRPSWSWARRPPWRWNRTSPGPPSGRTQLSSERVPQTRKRCRWWERVGQKCFLRTQGEKKKFQQEAGCRQEVIRPLREEMLISMSMSVTSLAAVVWWEDKLQDVTRWISNTAKSSEIENSIAYSAFEQAHFCGLRILIEISKSCVGPNSTRRPSSAGVPGHCVGPSGATQTSMKPQNVCMDLEPESTK